VKTADDDYDDYEDDFEVLCFILCCVFALFVQVYSWIVMILLTVYK